MRKTKMYHFLMPDIQERYDVNVQNKNWNRLDRILAWVMITISVQTMVLISVFCGQNIGQVHQKG